MKVATISATLATALLGCGGAPATVESPTSDATRGGEVTTLESPVTATDVDEPSAPEAAGAAAKKRSAMGGEGSCGGEAASKDGAEGSCGGDKGSKQGGEASCGEGSCGG